MTTVWYLMKLSKMLLALKSVQQAYRLEELVTQLDKSIESRRFGSETLA